MMMQQQSVGVMQFEPKSVRGVVTLGEHKGSGGFGVIVFGDNFIPEVGDEENEDKRALKFFGYTNNQPEIVYIEKEMEILFHLRTANEGIAAPHVVRLYSFFYDTEVT